MIKFKLNETDNSKINAIITTGYPVDGWTMTFSHGNNSKFEALLALENIQNKMNNLILQIKKDCYNKGYKDGRSKKAKREYIHTIYLKVDADPNNR